MTLLAYLPAVRNGFVNLDDKDYVTENPMVTRGVTWSGIQWAFTTLHASNWHPLTWLSHMLDCALFRLNPSGHHLVNVLLHGANAGLLFALWWRMTGALWRSAMVAALFAWHPLHVESVAWVAERKDVLSTFFALLALLSYVRSTRPPAAAPDEPPARKSAYWLALLFFGLGLMAKPMLVTLPFVMVLLDFWPLKRNVPLPKLLVGKWPFFVLTLASCAVTVLAQRAEAIAPLAKFSLGLRLENVLTAYAGYLWMTIWPARLAAFYPLVQPDALTVGLSLAVLLAISVLACRRAKRQPYLLAGWLWYLGTLVPVIGLLQVGDQALADRYTYFPLIGIFFAVVWAAANGARDLKLPAAWPAAAGALTLGGCLLVTENQIRTWQDSETLFTHALAVTRDNAPARLNLGEAFQEQNRPDDALVEYKKALALNPSRPEIYNNIARLLNDQGKPAAALEYCQTAVSLNPQSAPSRVGLGMVFSELGRYDDAMKEFSEAARLNPLSAAPHFQSGRTLLKLGRDADAVAAFREALRREPDNVGILIFVARVLASDENAPGRDGAEACALAGRAAQLAGQQQPVVLDTLAMACAETGDFNAATNFVQHAIDAALAGGDREDATAMQQRLELYRRRQPARIPYRSEDGKNIQH